MAKEYEYTCDDDILCGVNVPKDTSNLAELEEKHLPVITASDAVDRNQSFEVTIEVGKCRKRPNNGVHPTNFISSSCN